MVADRDRDRRRRVDPDPRGVVRSGGPEAHDGRDRARPGPRLDRLLDRRAARDHGRRRAAAARRDGGPAAGDPAALPGPLPAGPSAPTRCARSSGGPRWDRCRRRWRRRSTRALGALARGARPEVDRDDARRALRRRSIDDDWFDRVARSTRTASGASGSRRTRTSSAGDPRVPRRRAVGRVRGVPGRPPPSVRLRPGARRAAGRDALICSPVMAVDACPADGAAGAGDRRRGLVLHAGAEHDRPPGGLAAGRPHATACRSGCR